MKKIILAFLIVLVGFSAVAKRHTHKTKKQTANEIISVAIEHTPCFGRCPDYIVEVNKNGIATYTGVRFTRDSGVFTKNIGKAKAKQIIDRFNVYRVDTCKDLYTKRNTDFPGYMITVNYNSTTKTISNADYAPIGLRTIAGSIDSLTGDKVDKTWRALKTPKKKK